MLSYVKRLLTNTCPCCNDPLAHEHHPLGYVKSCARGHYKEETFSYLGVRIVYKDLE
ncbi:hypothetical protein [Paenibacillus mendelii]|uniref:Uncharacterized protein n=1 Tax=Paenibacillus mendelii TaxID=206163 RepID=A0ABV6JG57_9BACL|nr:hypothetical protein [Paenibacillus mendelii]